MLLTYVLRRILLTIPVLLGITLITFSLMQMVPGDPVNFLMDSREAIAHPDAVKRIRKQWGLDRPVPVQYLYFLGNAVQGDLGTSFRTNRPVASMLMQRFPATVRLAVASLILATVLGVGVGIISAIKRNSIFDTGSMIFALLGVSTPVFWLGLLLMLYVGVHLRWLPPSGYGRGQWHYLILPAITLGTAITGLIARTTRSAMLNVIRQDYITTARAKGISNTRVTYKHALRNALIPVITVVGVQAGNVLSGAVVTETVFNWPGIGRLLVDSISQRDLPMAQGCVLFIALVFVLVNLFVDLIYSFIDPRIRYN